MARNWLEKLNDKNKKEVKNSKRHYRNAIEFTEKIRSKYGCGLSELPMGRLNNNEKKKVYKAWLELGYSKQSASLIVYGNTYQHALL